MKNIFVKLKLKFKKTKSLGLIFIQLKQQCEMSFVEQEKTENIISNEDKTRKHFCKLKRLNKRN